ncbi:MAG TPA: hypothetical protein PLD25_20575 [Chloroflexota bacterium]|nr:hypothetical protein [Chloroflexota bacterium]
MSSDAIDWSTKRDTEINISGIAQNAKAGALLMIGPENAILVRGLSEWDTTTLGKKVMVEAIVRRAPGYPKAKVSGGLLMQGTASGGDTWVLELKNYRILD